MRVGVADATNAKMAALAAVREEENEIKHSDEPVITLDLKMVKWYNVVCVRHPSLALFASRLAFCPFLPRCSFVLSAKWRWHWRVYGGTDTARVCAMHPKWNFMNVGTGKRAHSRFSVTSASERPAP